MTTSTTHLELNTKGNTGAKRPDLKLALAFTSLMTLRKGLRGPRFPLCKVGRTFPTPLSRLVRAIKEIVGLKGVGIQRRCSASKLLSLSPEAPTRRSGSPCASSAHERTGILKADKVCTFVEPLETNEKLLSTIT